MVWIALVTHAVAADVEIVDWANVTAVPNHVLGARTKHMPAASFEMAAVLCARWEMTRDSSLLRIATAPTAPIAKRRVTTDAAVVSDVSDVSDVDVSVVNSDGGNVENAE
jgi:hypothetical protein